MENYSIHLPSYSIGKDVYKEIPEICGKYGNKIVAIGGHKALAAAKDKILEAIKAVSYTHLNSWHILFFLLESIQRMK